MNPIYPVSLLKVFMTTYFITNSPIDMDYLDMIYTQQEIVAVSEVRTSDDSPLFKENGHYVDVNGWGHQFTISYGSPASSEFEGYALDSLAFSISNSIPSLQSRHNPTNDRALFATFPARNSSCWIADFAEKASVSTMNGSPLTSWTSASLISPIHMIGCNHWPSTSVGRTYQFVDNSGTAYTRTVVAEEKLDNDIRVMLLDSELPVAFTPFKGIAPGSTVKIPSFNQNDSGMIGSVYTEPPVIVFDKEHNANLWDSSITDPWQDIGISGDSGHPWTVPIDGHLVLVGHYFYSTRSPYYSYEENFVAITNAMHELSVSEELETDYTFETVDLSMWPDFL